VTSAAAFSIGALLPLVAMMLAPIALAIPVVAVATLASLALLGTLSAQAGGAGVLKAAARVTIWGTIAMALTAAIGSMVGKVI